MCEKVTIVQITLKFIPSFTDQTYIPLTHCIPVRLSRNSYIWYPGWRRHHVLNKYSQKYNFFVFVFNSTEVETATLKIFCVIIPSLVYTCRDFGLFRVVRPYLSFRLSYLSDLSGLIKVFWTKEYNAKHHYTVKWFFRGFWSVFDLYSLIFWQNCVIHQRHHSYIWMTSSQNEFIIRTPFWIHILTWFKVKPYKLHVYDSDNIGK